MSYGSFIMKVVMIGWIKDVGKMFTTLKIAKEWNLEERQTCDDGDPYQVCMYKGISVWLTCLGLCVMRMTLSKGISVWLTRFGLCVMQMTPLLMLIDSSKKERKC